MQLSAGLIAKFQQAHVKEFGYAISAEVAETELISLAELLEITAHTHRPADKKMKDGEKNGA